MGTNHVVLLDYCVGEIIKIRLNPEQIAESESYADFEEYLVMLEEEYNFRLSNCTWMSCEVLSERSY